MDHDAYAELRQPGRITVTLAPDVRRALHRVADTNFREPRLEAQRLLTEAVLREAGGGGALELREAPALAGPAEAGAVHLSDLLLREAGEP